MRRILLPFLLLALPALCAAAEEPARPSGRTVAGELPGEVSHVPTRLLEMHSPLAMTRTEPTVCPDSFDMIHYELHVDVDHTAGLIDGDAYLTFQSLKDNLSSVRFDLRLLTATGVNQDGSPVSYSQVGDTLFVDLAAPIHTGDTATVEVLYSGTPGNEGGGGFGGFWIWPGIPAVDFSMGVGLYTLPPSMGRYWFPGVDAPCDKATFEIYSETPGVKMAVSNGYLESVTVDTATGRKTWHWVEDHPIATYLMALSISKYTEMPDTTDSRIFYYIYRGEDSLSAVAFQNVDEMMACYESLYGPYPFDKFSYVVTPLGDMEHQTCVSHVRWTMDYGTDYDDLLAHEMSHQWFGDYTTYADWRDVWLSEGFATYSEALWREYKYGTTNYHNYVRVNLMGPYLGAAHVNTGPIYDPDFLWGVLSYEKGGTVLHMLRHVMGDSLFFASLNAYKAAHPYGTATTPDFQAACEGVYGSSLSWFFDEWIYSGGHPVFDWGWSYAETGLADYEVEIQTHQVQTIGPIFTMPVDFLIATAGGDTTVVGWVNAETNVFSFTVPGEPLDVTMDPDNWLLDQHQLVSTSVAAGGPAPVFSLGSCRPNPFNPVTMIPFSLPSRGAVTLQVFSVRGELVRTLIGGETLPAGAHGVKWDGTDETARPVASGVYFYRLSEGERQETRKMLLIR